MAGGGVRVERTEQSGLESSGLERWVRVERTEQSGLESWPGGVGHGRAYRAVRLLRVGLERWVRYTVLGTLRGGSGYTVLGT